MHNCLICFSEATELHHISPRSTHPEAAASVDNVIWVCRNCHTNIHAHNTQKLRQTLYNRQKIYAKIMPERFAVSEEDIAKFLTEEVKDHVS